MIFILNSASDDFLICACRMRALLSKELSILKNSPQFFHVSVYGTIKYKDSHFTDLRKSNTVAYLLSVPIVCEIIEQIFPLYEKNIKLVQRRAIDFPLFVLSDAPVYQISTTIIRLLRQTFCTFIVMEGLRHLLCWHVPTGNDPVVLAMVRAMSIFRVEGKIKNEYVFVFVSMIGAVCFTFGSASDSANAHFVMRQSSDFQPEDNSCDGH